ncbi:hypothetical protein V8E55_001240 [Tylopilus felleus]
MASWIDVFSLVLTTLFFVGAILGVLYAAHAISTSIRSTKASLEARGITLSREGVSLKTQKRFDRDAYLDVTQRGLIKVLGAATVGSESNKHDKHTFHHLGPPSYADRSFDIGRRQPPARARIRVQGQAGAIVKGYLY